MNPVRIILTTLVLFATVACAPLGPFAGGRLRGTVETHPDSWASISEIEQFQLETRPGDPHSVNIWSGTLDGNLYIATSLILGTDIPSERNWVKHVVQDPNVRLRSGHRIFELRAVRVEDQPEVERARAALIEKYNVEEDPHSSAAWIFRLEPR